MNVSAGDLGKRVRLLYADGSTRAEGTLYAYSVVPVVYIRHDDGTTESWRHDQAVVIGRGTP